MKVDFHTHTYCSADSLTSIDELILTARKRGLDRVVVTDHNTIRGAMEAQAAAPGLIVIGEEVQTTEGEFLAAYVTKEIPRELEPMEALKRLKDQGAFISVSHPFDPHRSGWSLTTLEKLAPLIDAIEILNARVFRKDHNKQALSFALYRGLPGTAGSDAHHATEIGRVYSILPDFHDAESLREAIKSATTGGVISPGWVHIFSTRARFLKAFDNRNSRNENR